MGKYNEQDSEPKSVITLIGGNEIIQNFSNNQVSLSSLDTWSELTNQQQNYISCYTESTMQETQARIKSLVTKQELQKWKANPAFMQAIEDVEALFTEGLRSIDYQEAITNSKIRGRVLQSRDAKGYEKKSANTTNNIINTNGDGLLGLMKAFNKST